MPTFARLLAWQSAEPKRRQGRWRDGADDPFVVAIASVKAKAVTKDTIQQFQRNRLVEKVVAPAPASASSLLFFLLPLKPLMHTGKGQRPP
jgi:hypothetical protein